MYRFGQYPERLSQAVLLPVRLPLSNAKWQGDSGRERGFQAEWCPASPWILSCAQNEDCGTAARRVTLLRTLPSVVQGQEAPLTSHVPNHSPFGCERQGALSWHPL